MHYNITSGLSEMVNGDWNGQEGFIKNVVAVVQFLSCVWLFDPMDCSMTSFPVLPEFAQTHVHGRI